MSKKFYVVWKGAKTGIFTSWPETKALIDGRSDAQYMGFPSLAEAEAAFAQSYTKALMQRSLAKGKTSGGGNKASGPGYQGQSQKPGKSAQVQIYCDGACSPNPGKSGTGLAIYESSVLTELRYGLYQPMGTNNTAELGGILESMLLAQTYIGQGKTVEILSDSKYSIDCITKWAKGWQAKGWTRGKGEEIKNLEIIQRSFALYEQLKSQLFITHVKGHANIEGNELADRMAVYARMKQETELVVYQEALDIPFILAMPSG
ncbi:viroplasmin family protein [Thalassomonas viridans]|uniref:ribonuclease H n=1 Tax=Thalassomonas viridans TaxID=137584 RepID=A0AAE9Z010_9GAMM|nr:ribonuclease H family protein [Thalassomonas viridans]WDE04296.1 viroplasmin family protein [Thalassomonas viridans]